MGIAILLSWLRMWHKWYNSTVFDEGSNSLHLKDVNYDNKKSTNPNLIP